MSRAIPPLHSRFSLLALKGVFLLALLFWLGLAQAFDALELRARLDENPYSAARSAEETVSRARLKGDTSLQLEALTTMAMAYNLIGDSSRAAAPVEEATELATRLKQHSALALLLSVRGEMLAADNQPEAAIRAFEAALGEARQARDASTEAIVQSQYGTTQADTLAMHAKAAGHLEAALSHFTEIGDRGRQAEVISAFASLYERLHEEKRAISERRRALALISPEKQTYLAASIYYDFGSSPSATETNVEAETALLRSIALSQSIADEFGIAYSQGALAKLYIKSKRWREALAQLRKARPVLLRGQNTLAVAQLDARAAICLAMLGDPSAWAALAAAKPVLTGNGNPSTEHAFRKAQAEVNAAFHHFEAAYLAQQRLLEIENKMFDSDRTRILSELSVRYETRQREAENAQLRLTQQIRDAQLAHQKSQQLTLQAGLAFALIGLIVILALLRRQTQLKARFEELALRDELTGAPNRRAIMAQAARLVASAQAQGSAVALIDLDHFKQVNDNWGHDAGDEVLRSFYRTAREAIRDSDSLGRTGGEEWLLLLPDAAESGAEAAFQRIRAALQALRIGAVPADYRLSFSMGLALFGKGESLSEALRRADLALYRAKEEGRDRVVIAP